MIYVALQWVAMSVFLWGASMAVLMATNAVWGAIWAGADHFLKDAPPYMPDITLST